MNLLPGLSLVKILVYLAIVAALVGLGARLEHNRMQKKLDKAVAEHNQFKGGVAALGEAAKTAAAVKALQDIKAKERADENTKRNLERSRSDIARLRADADRARGGRLPAAPAGSGCPAAWVCYDRAALERADRARRDSIRSAADRGTEVEINHREAVEWANP